MCQSCISGYSKSANVCQKCPQTTQNMVYLSLIVIFIVVAVGLMVFFNIKMADRPASNYTILIKILINYIQIISIVASLNLDWPDFALQYLNVQETAGSFSQQSFSFDCHLSQKYVLDNSQVYFYKLIVYMIMPIVLIFLSLLSWSVVSLIYKDLKYIKNHFVGSIVIIVFILHTILLKMTLSPFSCQEINSEYWLTDDMSIKCWEGMHLTYTLGVALPGLILWGGAVPLTATIFVFRNRQQFDDLKIKQRYGFITTGYVDEHYYWEIVIMYRKMFVISASLFFASLSVDLQTLSVLIICRWF
jgi:hypothetical protein